jgi:asparagine synthase (glutamine-hydrolysing)
VSFFIGVFSLSDSPLRTTPQALEAAAALPNQFRLSKYCDTRLALLHGDLGVYPEAGWFESDHAIGAVAGLMLLGAQRPGEAKRSGSELSQAVGEMNAGRASFLRNANGTFAVCAYDKQAHRLTLAGDSLGARPLYYAKSDGQLYFATSIDALVRLNGVPRTFDVATYIEEEALCYPLGCRTKFVGVRVVVDNEAIVAADGAVRPTRYYDWRSLTPARESLDDLAMHCRTALRQAVESRAPPGSRQICLLSGGIDSRLVAAELLALGREVEAINASPPGSQDQVYAQRFAEAANIALTTRTDAFEAMSAADRTATLLSTAVARLERCSVFTGDGGGETFGFLLMKERAPQLLHEGKLRASVEVSLNGYAPPRRLFKPKAYQRLRTAAHDRMEAELERIGISLGEKALQIFVLTNDLRCHLHEYFNRLPHTRVELLLPYYDRRVIESVLRIPPPLEPLMKHAFYLRMLGLFPAVVTAVPWQTYPGHAPCPVPDENPPPNQWSIKNRFGDTLASRSLAVALAPGFAPVLRRSAVLAAVALHKMRRGDFTYLFKSCLNVQARCGGETSWVLRDDSLDEGPARQVRGHG